MKQPKYPLVDDWIKMWYVYAMEHYSAVRKNKILPFTTAWVDVENIMLREISWVEKAKKHIVSVTYGI